MNSHERGSPTVFSIGVHPRSLVAPTGFALEGLRDAERIYEKTTTGRARDGCQELHNAERAASASKMSTGFCLPGNARP